MNRSPTLDNELTTSSSPVATAKDSSERMLRIPEAPNPSRRVNLVEEMVLSDTNESDDQDASGKAEETQSLMFLQGIMFGILVMAIIGAVITLAFVAR